MRGIRPLIPLYSPLYARGYGIVPPGSVSGANALNFPINGAAPQPPSATMVGLKLANPQNDGMGPWNCTYVWRALYNTQNGYYTTFFWGQDDGGINFTNDTPYYGAHPYDFSGTDGGGSNHRWEIAYDGGDVTLTRAGTNKTVVKDTWFTQMLRVILNGNGTKTLIYYTALPSTANADVIEAQASSAYGSSLQGGMPFAINIADARWANGYPWRSERGLRLSSMKMFKVALSESDGISEALDFSRLVTTAGQNNIYWGKDGFDTVDSLTCSYGSGKVATHTHSTARPTLVARG